MWRQQSVFFRQVLVVYDVLVSAAAFLATLFVRQRLGPEADGQVGWVTRTLVVVSTLYSVSDTGLGANALTDFRPVGFAPFEP